MTMIDQELLDEFAGRAMQGLVAGGNDTSLGMNADAIARAAYVAATAMMSERAKRMPAEPAKADREPRRVWVNTYPDGGADFAHYSANAADANAGEGRIACVEFVEVVK